MATLQTLDPPITIPKQIEDLTLLDEVSARTAGVSRLEMCIQCGTCGGSCPSSADMDHTPRMLFAMLRAGMREAALKSNTPWICVSCYHCVVRCPQNVHIADVMYTLKGMAIEAQLFQDSTAPDFSKTFVDMVEEYGRGYEFGLAQYGADGIGVAQQTTHDHYPKAHQRHQTTQSYP